MKKCEMVELIEKKCGMKKNEIENVFYAFQEVLKDALCKGESVNLSNFGKFFVVDRKSVRRVNPITKRFYFTRAQKVTVFKPYKKLKHCVN